MGAAAAALLVRDWSVLNDGGTLIRTRWGHIVARILPFVGLAVLAAAAHYATGSVSDFRSGLLIVVALAAVLVVAPVALEQDGPVARVLAWRPLVWLGRDLLRRLPLALADLLGAQRRTHGVVGLAAVRVALCGDGGAGRSVVVAAGTADPAVASGDRPDAAAGGCDGSDRRGRDDDSVAGGRETRGGAGSGDRFCRAGRAGGARRSPQTVRADPGTRTVSVFGDSIAWTMMRYLPPTPGLAFTNYTTIGCGIARGGPYRYVGQTLNQKPECDAWPSRWSQRINHDRPDVVLLIVGRWEVVDRMNEGRWTHIGETGYEEYLRGELNRALDILGSTGARIVVTTEPYNRRAEKPDGSLYPEDDPDRVDEWNALLRSVVKARPNVSVLDLNRKLGPNGVYTNRVDGIRVRSDGVHPTPEAVKWLTPWLTDALR